LKICCQFDERKEIGISVPLERLDPPSLGHGAAGTDSYSTRTGRAARYSYLLG
jgi:hypothetical protein